MPTYINISNSQLTFSEAVFAPGQIKSVPNIIEHDKLIMLSMSPTLNVVRDFREITLAASATTVIDIDDLAQYVKIYGQTNPIDIWPTNFGGDGNELLENNDFRLWNDTDSVPYLWTLEGTNTATDYIRRSNPGQKNSWEQVDIYSSTTDIGISQDVLTVGELYYWSIYIPYIESVGDGLELLFGTQSFTIDSAGMSSGTVTPDGTEFIIKASPGTTEATSMRFTYPSVQKLDGDHMILDVGEEFQFYAKPEISRVIISSTSTVDFKVLQARY